MVPYFQKRRKIMEIGWITPAPRVYFTGYGKVITSPYYNDVIITAMAFQFTSLTSVYSTVYSGADQRKHQSSASLAFVRGIHRWRGTFPFDDVIMTKYWGIINYPCPNFNGGLVIPPSKLGHGWIITSHTMGVFSYQWPKRSDPMMMGAHRSFQFYAMESFQ